MRSTTAVVQRGTCVCGVLNAPFVRILSVKVLGQWFLNSVCTSAAGGNPLKFNCEWQ